MIQVNRIYLIFNRLVTKKFLVDTSGPITTNKIVIPLSWSINEIRFATSILLYHYELITNKPNKGDNLFYKKVY